jgi:hypothetical protein
MPFLSADNARTTALLFAAVGAVCVGGSYANLRLGKAYQRDGRLPREPLPDLGAALLPDLSAFPWLIDAPFLCMVPLFFLVVPSPRDALFDLVVLTGCLYVARAFTTNVTLLPSADPDARPEDVTWTNVWRGSCWDLVMSGHTFLTILMLLVLYRHCFARRGADGDMRRAARVWIAFTVAVYCCIVVATKSHYTVDVLLSVILALGIYQLYYESNAFSGLHSSGRRLR